MQPPNDRILMDSDIHGTFYNFVDIFLPTLCTYMFLMRDEKEERKKQAIAKRQSNTAHPRQVYTR